MYNGSNDSFNFKPHELTLITPFGITMASLGNSIIKRAVFAYNLQKTANKKTSRQKLSGRKFYLISALIVDAD